jgi:1-deoxy-D-xylulose-5-phosphate reductoisomerase
MARRVAVLGSTGSIGTQALEVIQKSPELRLHSIVCRTSTEKLSRQAEMYAPGYSSCVGGCDPSEVLYKAIDGADMVLNAIVGSAGLRASLIAQEMAVPLALANKESLVVGADLLRKHLHDGLVIPVDSEHSTVFRCLQGETRRARRITLTASGGSLRDMPVEEMYHASLDRVLNHPTWKMGGRITVDSATMVNKAFEVIEARALFPGMPVDVVINRSSIVHSLVETADGAWKALLGLPDMKVPIAWALLYPDMPTFAVASENPLDWGTIAFQPVEEERYAAYTEVLLAGDMGGTAPAVANAADEVAVTAFLAGSIPFGAIAEIIASTLHAIRTVPVETYDHIAEMDKLARETAGKAVEQACSL